MDTQRIIQCIGTNEEDTAHLRLLLRVARTHVRNSWVWGSESRADLVVVDTRRLIGESAMRRAAQRGIDCAQIIEANAPKPPGLFLRKPFRREAFAMLLNKVGGGTGAGPEIDTWSDEFLELDLGGVDLSELEAEHPGGHGATTRPGDAADIQAVPVHARSSEASADPFGMANAEKADAGVARERMGERDALDTVPVDLPGGSIASHRPVDDIFDPALEADSVPDIDANATYPLIYYLGKGLLPGPARIAVPGMPTLVVDPEEELFWAKGLLPGLEPYARAPLRFGDWQRLDWTELVEARRGMAAKPYARLIWMDTFIHSNGFLARHLDPGGSYRLSNRLDFSLDYPRAFRVGALMTTPRKLHEIARVSAVGLAEVFDVVNAYEAIGYIEWTPRERTPR